MIEWERLSSKKRKQLQTSSSGIFTRNKSQTLIHRTRSGRARLDLKHPIHPNHLTQSPQQFSSSTNPKNPINEERLSIKDLRTRRVFSPASIGGEVDVHDSKKRVQSVVRFSQKDQKKMEIEIDKASRDGDDRIHTTPPDVTIDGLHVPKNPSNERVFGEKEKNPNSKGVLLPCSRTKLYRAPNSFSYRRLLPFIMDLKREDGAYALELRPCQNIENPVEEKPLPSLSVNHDVPIDVLNDGVLTVKHPLDARDASPTQEVRESIPSDGSSYTNSSNLESDKRPITEVDIQNPQASVVSIGGVHVDDLKNVQSNVGFSGEDQKQVGHTEVEIEKSSCDGDEWIQMTPPGTETDGAHVLKNPSTERVFSEKDKINSKALFVPSSRAKLFKTPGSFSYRRLLPFLMDLAKEDNCKAMEIHPYQKTEKLMEEEPLPSLLVNHDVPSDELTTKHPLSELDASPTQESNETISNGLSYVYCSNLESADPPVESDDIQITPESSIKSTEHRSFEPEIQTSPEASIVYTTNDLMNASPQNLCTESAPLVKQDMPDLSNKPEPAYSAIYVHETDTSDKFSCSVVIDDPELIKVGTSRGPDFSIEVEDDCTKLDPSCSRDVMSHGALELNQIPSNIEVFTPLEKLISDPLKGILKRYPRGCRGLCNCLNCASFHLHSERAFEFSRNQMQDAEDLAQGLMKELSDLRSLLEKSVDGEVCHAVLQVSKVKEACSKAFIAQELAKRRISEMNYEVNIHCRTPSLQRPRVRFADQGLMPVTEKLQANSTMNERL